MAELCKFYGGAVTPEGFEQLNAGQLGALVEFKTAYLKARSESHKSGK